MGDPDIILGFGLRSGPAIAIMIIWRMNQQMKSALGFPSLSILLLSLYNIAFQKSKAFLERKKVKSEDTEGENRGLEGHCLLVCASVVTTEMAQIYHILR